MGVGIELVPTNDYQEKRIGNNTALDFEVHGVHTLSHTLGGDREEIQYKIPGHQGLIRGQRGIMHCLSLYVAFFYVEILDTADVWDSVEGYYCEGEAKVLSYTSATGDRVKVTGA